MGFDIIGEDAKFLSYSDVNVKTAFSLQLYYNN